MTVDNHYAIYIMVFWVIIACHQAGSYCSFGERYCLHHQSISYMPVYHQENLGQFFLNYANWRVVQYFGLFIKPISKTN
jgi:hypothetical protein